MNQDRPLSGWMIVVVLIVAGTALGITALVTHSGSGGQGEINWSSQHLDHGGVHGTKVRMKPATAGRPAVRKRNDRRTSAYIGGRFPPRERRRSRGERTGSGSGRRSLGG